MLQTFLEFLFTLSCDRNAYFQVDKSVSPFLYACIIIPK